MFRRRENKLEEEKSLGAASAAKVSPHLGENSKKTAAWRLNEEEEEKVINLVERRKKMKIRRRLSASAK